MGFLEDFAGGGLKNFGGGGTLGQLGLPQQPTLQKLSILNTFWGVHYSFLGEAPPPQKKKEITGLQETLS